MVRGWMDTIYCHSGSGSWQCDGVCGRDAKSVRTCDEKNKTERSTVDIGSMSFRNIYRLPHGVQRYSVLSGELHCFG